MKRVILTADDFGLTESVNEAVEMAHRDGVLTAASLMVAAPAAADAVRRARRLPTLRVGLHLVAVEGPLVLPPGQAGPDQLRLALAYGFDPGARRRLAAEIEAQFAAFAATGLTLDHADAHKHMHLHPVVGGMMIRIGRRFGLRAVRVPSEPPGVMAPAMAGGRLLHAWTRVLRWRVRRAGLECADSVFGIARSGHMTERALLGLIPQLPDGVSEIYFHPAARRDPALAALMPEYEHEAELAALLSPRVRQALADRGMIGAGYGLR